MAPIGGDSWQSNTPPSRAKTISPNDFPMPAPLAGAPLANQTNLLPADILGEAVAQDRRDGSAAGFKSGVVGSRKITEFLDAPARAALGMPNTATAAKQARAARRGDAMLTPEFEFDNVDKATLLDNLHSPTTNSFPFDRRSVDGSSFPPSRDSSPGPSQSRPSSTLLRRILVDRPNSPSQHLLRPTFPPPSLSTYEPQPPRAPSLTSRILLFFTQLFSLAVSTVFLLGVVVWAMSVELISRSSRLLQGRPPKKVFPWDDDAYWRKNEKVSKDPKDYARAIKMDIEDQTVETEDGYYLRVHRVIDPDAKLHSNGKGGFPVLILHGLFQSSGSFITSEDRSLAFWLSKQGGYQVYLGNTRGVFKMGHRSYPTSDPRFWDWTIRELAMYDLPALVEHVCRETGYEKIGFIGHSQGNGLAFVSLSIGMCPDLGKKITLFAALAPAVYAGPLTTGFPFTALSKMEWKTWKRFFGVLDFIPIMRWSYDHVPAKMFSAVGYIMFAFLFNWTDTNWLHRRKTKMFRFTPTPVSSASIFWWCGSGGFAHRGCTMDDTLDRWFDKRFPPLSIYYGGRDFLVLTEPLLERFREKDTDVEVIRVEKLDLSEHCDFYWSAEAVEWVYYSLRDDLEKTRPRYPEEQLEERHA